MGVFISKTAESSSLIIDSLLLAYRRATHAQLRESWNILREVHGLKMTLDAVEFDEVFGFWIGDADPHFKFWERRGHVDCFEVFCGTIVFAYGDFADKCHFMFDFFDLNRDGVLSIDELTILVMSCVRGMCRLARIPFQIDLNFIKEIEATAKSAFESLEKRSETEISRAQFISWALSDADILRYYDRFNGGTNIFMAIDRVKEECQSRMKLFDTQCYLASKKMLNASAMALLQTQFSASTEDEIKELMFAAGLITLHRSHFEAMARALIAFDVVDKNHSGQLPLRDLQTLLWLTQGSEPSQALLTQQTSCFEALCLNKSISRLQFARQACIDAAGGGFEARFKVCFDRHVTEAATETIDDTKLGQALLDSVLEQAAFGISSDNQLVLTERAHQAALEVIHFVKAQQQAAEAEQLAAQAASADPVPSPKASPKASPKNAPPTSPLATPAKQPQPSPKATKPSPKPQSSPASSAAGAPSTPTATDTPEQLAAVLEFVQWSALRLVISALYQHHTTLVEWVHELGEPVAVPEVKEQSVPAGAAELSSALGGADVVKAARGEVNSFGEAVMDARAFESILSESIRINCGSAADQLPVEVRYKLLTSAALEILKALGLPPTGIIPMSDLAAADKQAIIVRVEKDTLNEVRRLISEAEQPNK